MTPLSPPLELDIASTSLPEVNEKLRSFSEGEELSAVVVHGAEGHDLLGVAIHAPLRVVVKGALGDYCFASNQHADIEVDGDVDAACGHSIQSGKVLIRGSAGSSLGALGRAGSVIVLGTAGPKCAVGLQGADVIVFGNVGPFGGYNMCRGTLIIGGDAGQQLGLGMSGGVIYLRGQAESLAPGVTEDRMKEPDRLRLGLLLLATGEKLNAKDFRKYTFDSEAASPRS